MFQGSEGDSRYPLRNIGVHFRCLAQKIEGPGLPGGSIIYQTHLFAKNGHLQWMDEILHHFETWLVGIYVGESNHSMVSERNGFVPSTVGVLFGK